MNAEQCAIVQRLISDLDDTHFLYLRFKPLLSHAHVRFLVSQMIDLHSAIADDLAWQMQLTGGLAARRGTGAWAWLRARAACWWMAFGSTDSEMSCLARIVRREDRLARKFQTVVAQVGDLHRKQDRLLALERTVHRVESLIHLMQASSPDASQPAAIAAYVPVRARPRR
jgi:hypothetical protein